MRLTVPEQSRNQPHPGRDADGMQQGGVKYSGGHECAAGDADATTGTGTAARKKVRLLPNRFGSVACTPGRYFDSTLAIPPPSG